MAYTPYPEHYYGRLSGGFLDMAREVAPGFEAGHWVTLERRGDSRYRLHVTFHPAGTTLQQLQVHAAVLADARRVRHHDEAVRHGVVA